MKGVVLAAGKGSRLYPVTKAIAKPLLPLAGRMTMEYAFDQFKECGITEVCVVAGENESELCSALGDGSQFGVHLDYVKQTEPLGLAHAVSYTETFVNGDDFMLYLGDAIYGQSLASFVDQFKLSGAANLNLVKEVADPRRFGVANVENGRIVKLVEKPEHPESNLAMAGMYIFGPQIWSVLPKLEKSGRGEYEITDAIQLLVDRDDLVIPGVYDGTWFDTGTLDSFLSTSRFLTEGGKLVASTSQVSGELVGHVVIGEGATVRCDQIENSVVLPGASVHAKSIRGSIVGGKVANLGEIMDEIVFGDLK